MKNLLLIALKKISGGWKVKNKKNEILELIKIKPKLSIDVVKNIFLVLMKMHTMLFLLFWLMQKKILKLWLSS